MKRTYYTLLAAFLSLGCVHSAHAQILTTIAGVGTFGNTGNGGPATAAEINYPTGLATDKHGNIYIADSVNQCVRKIDATGTISIYAGIGTTGYTGDGAAATAAQFNNITGVATDTLGNVYVADYGNNVVRMINTTGVISTVAGNNTAGYLGDGAAATAAELNGPYAIAVDNNNNLYISDLNNSVVREVTATTGVISTVAGNGTSGLTGDGGPATAAELSQPFGLAYYAGVLYIADANNNVIRKVMSGNIYPFAGNGVSGYIGDGGAPISAEFNNIRGLGVDRNGNIYIADQGNSAIRRISPSLVISTIAGTGTPGSSGDGGPATAAELNYPIATACDTNGNVYIADLMNNLVRKISAIPSLAIIGDTSICNRGGTTTLTDAVSGGTWSSSAPAIATVGTSGVVTGLTPGSAIISYHTSTGGAARTVIVRNCFVAVPVTNAIADEMSVYPNPNEGSFSVQVSSAYDEQAVVSVTNIVGDRVNNLVTTTNKTEAIKLNVPDGMYFINASTPHGSYTQKIVVTK